MPGGPGGPSLPLSPRAPIGPYNKINKWCGMYMLKNDIPNSLHNTHTFNI